jgi:hypothetical protein
MVVGHEFYTAWIAQTKLEHPVEVAKCPRCGCTVADVNRGIERHSEEAEPGVLVLDLKETPPTPTPLAPSVTTRCASPCRSRSTPTQLKDESDITPTKG